MVKPNRKTWIFGVRGTKARINNPTRQAIIELFLEVSNADHSAAINEIDHLGRQIARLEGKELTPVENRQLHQYRKELTILRGKVDPAREQDAARTEALNLSLIRGVREVRVIHKKLLFVTAPIKIGKASLGTYDVILYPHKTVPADAIDLLRRDRCYEHGPHPHWSSRPCFGTWGPMLSQMLKCKNWSAVVGAMLNYLSRYYGKSPLIGIEQFYPGGYYENLRPTV